MDKPRLHQQLLQPQQIRHLRHLLPHLHRCLLQRTQRHINVTQLTVEFVRPRNPLHQQRLEGVRAASKARGRLRSLSVVPGDFSVESGHAAAMALLAGATVPSASTHSASVFEPAIATPPPTMSQVAAQSRVAASPQRSGGRDGGMFGA